MEKHDFTEESFFEIKNDLQNIFNKLSSYKLSDGCKEELNRKAKSVLSSLIFEIKD